MSYILCRTKPADTPFYIENISTNIYSIEELCFYLYNNLYLVDETILNGKLCDWLQNVLGLTALSKKVRSLLEQKAPVGQILMPIFKEIYYLSHEEMRIFNAKLEQYGAQPERIRMKMKADYLYGNEKYRNALNIYKASLKLPEDDETGSQFKGSVYYNMGCAYARLFEFSEARECFKTAYEFLHTNRVLTGYLTAVCLADGEDQMMKTAESLGVDQDTVLQIWSQLEDARESFEESAIAARFQKLKERMENGDRRGYETGMKDYLKELTDTYHKNTGY